MGSTHVGSQLRDPTGASKKVQTSTARDMQPRRRMDSDQTVFRVYKGVKTFDFCKEKNVIVTGGEIIECLIFAIFRYTTKRIIDTCTCSIRGFLHSLFFWCKLCNVALQCSNIVWRFTGSDLQLSIQLCKMSALPGSPSSRRKCRIGLKFSSGARMDGDKHGSV